MSVNPEADAVVTATPQPGEQPWTTDDQAFAEDVAEVLREEWPYFRVEAA